MIYGNASPLLEFWIVFLKGGFTEETSAFVGKRKPVYKAK